MANVAFALRQLGLDAVVCAPIGTDPAGRLLQELMAEAGIPWLGSPAPSTPVSVGLPLDGERAFVTVHPALGCRRRSAIARIRPRAIVLNLPLPAGLPDEPRRLSASSAIRRSTSCSTARSSHGRICGP